MRILYHNMDLRYFFINNRSKEDIFIYYIQNRIDFFAKSKKKIDFTKNVRKINGTAGAEGGGGFVSPPGPALLPQGRKKRRTRIFIHIQRSNAQCENSYQPRPLYKKRDGWYDKNCNVPIFGCV
ncbi:hypothetical protein CAFE_35420 [Caprobacter fermentans]|uniref:Uncharacterized protein n=1 Tax=Caproicibacter fermentans TaxID=2576756 RepID=A0A6N8I4V3_9FIRM|nr:hypothetical protein [Caproicibacter fermentans]OCN01566.1 hypothetical protein A7X67_08845 [Clostridium sp. W14A]